MNKLVRMSLATFFLIAAACPSEAQDNTNTVLYDTFIKHKDNGKRKQKVHPYEPKQAADDYPRNIEIYRYNSYYGSYPYYGYFPYPGYTPFYGYPWHRDYNTYPSKHTRDQGGDRRYWRR